MSESITDIVREMRDGSIYDENGCIDLHEIADRIEAAYNRLNTKSPENVNSKKVIYNNAKMYEALMQIRDSVYIDPDDGKCQSDIDASDLREICDAALAEPPRNCDLVKNFYDAQKRFLRETGELIVRDEIYDWLFAKAKGVKENA